MNAAHIHLAINHLPVMGSLFALIFLIVALILKSTDLKRAALLIVFLVGLGALPAYFSGEGAEEIVEDQAGISESLIHEHEEAAEFALIVALIAAAAGLGGFIAARQRENLLKPALLVALLLTAGNCLVMARTANLGGRIAHPEIRDRTGGLPAETSDLPGGLEGEGDPEAEEEYDEFADRPAE